MLAHERTFVVVRSMAPSLEWLPAPAPRRTLPHLPVAWDVKILKSGLVFDRSAWEALSAPRLFDLGWDPNRAELWFVSSPHGQLEVKRTPGNGTMMRIGNPRMMEFIASHGFVPDLYQMMPAFFEPEHAFAFVIAQSSRMALDSPALPDTPLVTTLRWSMSKEGVP